MSNVKTTEPIKCVTTWQAPVFGHTYAFSGITRDELENNFEQHKEEIKNAIMQYTMDALSTDKDELLSYWCFQNYDNTLSEDAMEKVRNNPIYDDPNKIFEDFKDEVILLVTNGINELCDEGYNEDFFDIY